MKKILVTGGTGYIGSHCAILLLEKGYEVVLLDSHINSNPRTIRLIKNLCGKLNITTSNKLKTYQGDMRDINILEKVFSDAIKIGKPFQGVMHFAGLKSVSESVIEPLKYWDFNLISTINLLKVMSKYSCNSIIFSSSATIYQANNDFKIGELASINPINPYGNTKFAIEKFLSDIFFSEKHKWKIANLRYFNPIGAHESGLIGEDPRGIPNNIFPLIMNVASKKIKQLKIYGDDWPTKDGTGVRDYIHVVDLAIGHIKAIEFLFENDPQVISLNIGTGVGTSVLELIEIFQNVNNVEVPYCVVSRRTGDKASIIANNSKSTKYLNWVPKRDIQKMCKDGWKWQVFNNKF